MSIAALRDENEHLKALLAQTQAALSEHQGALAASEEARRRLEVILGELRRDRFGAKSEKLRPDQYHLPLEDVEIAQGILDAAQERAEAVIQGRSRNATDQSSHRNRGCLPAHLPRVERVIEPASTLCPCGCGAMTKIGEDVSQRLDVIPAQWRVLVTRRPKYICRRCSGPVVQAHAPEHVVPGGLPTEAAIAHVIVSKFGDHTPFTVRPRSMRARASGLIGRHWATGRAAPASIFSPSRTTCATLGHGGSAVHGRDQGASTRSGARPNEERLLLGDRLRRPRPQWSKSADRAVPICPGRSGAFAEQFLNGFGGHYLQCDAYDGYDRLNEVVRPQGPWTLVHCWSHLALRQIGTQQQVADRRSCRSAHRAALRHRSHGARLIAGHPAGRAQGALAAHGSRAKVVVRETAVDDLQRFDTRRGHPLCTESLAGADPLPRRRTSRARHQPGRERDPANLPDQEKRSLRRT